MPVTAVVLVMVAGCGATLAAGCVLARLAIAGRRTVPSGWDADGAVEVGRAFALGAGLAAEAVAADIDHNIARLTAAAVTRVIGATAIRGSPPKRIGAIMQDGS